MSSTPVRNAGYRVAKCAGYRAGILLAVALFVLLAGSVASVSAANIDLVVMVDTSESMFPYFDDLMNHLVQDLLTEKLHKGDTFHLLSFSSVPEVEISLAINSDEAAQRAFGRILLLHALGRYTDLVSALQFLDKYVKELPEPNPKQIILITDGVNDPPPGSSTGTDPAAVKSAIATVAESMRTSGWTFNILKVPPEPVSAQDAAKSFLTDIAQALGVAIVPYKVSDKEHTTGRTTGFPNLTFPAGLGKVGNRFVAPFKIKNWRNEAIIITLASVQSEGVELLDKKVSVTIPALAEAPFDVPLHLPISYPKGEHTTLVQTVFDDDPRISPTQGTLTFTYTGKGGLPIPRLTLLYVLYIVLGLAVVYLLIRLFLFMRKKMTEAPLTGIARGQAAAAALASGTAEEPRLAVAGAASAHAARGPKRVSLAEASHHAPAPKRLSLMDTTTGAFPTQRVRPTLTSLRRALPRAEMQQASLPPLIEMRVSQQNHRVGFRNVHRLSNGASRTVGGKFSGYQIFLVPIPASIAEIKLIDGSYVFTPLRSELFPSLSGPVQDCLGVEIPFISPKGKELTLYFREWVSPLDEINALMRQARSSDG
jgi:Mg-chelatase subunit ChlD